MKKLYSLTLCAVSSFLTLTTSAQSGGTYTAVLSGNWHTPSGSTPIWHDAEPPANCSNCLIQLLGSGVVHLNTNVNLSNNSSVVVGSGVILVVDNSNQNTFAGGYNLILGTETNSTLVFQDNAVLNATGAGTYDGILTSTAGGSSTTAYLKEYGTAGLFFMNDQEVNYTAPSGSTIFGPSTFNSSTGILPIIMGDFSATLNEGQVDLNWSTDLESNSDHFTVERSTNAGADWTTIGTVGAAGNSSGVRNYSFTDNKPAQGTNEYRLQLVDKDGKFSYSDVKSVRLGIVSSVSLYPNPARDYVNVTLNGSAGENMLIRLYNQSGQVLIEKNVSNAGGTTVSLSVSSYPEGNYIVVVSAADGSRQVNKLVINK